jgi:3-oxoadipate enol-lactonase
MAQLHIVDTGSPDAPPVVWLGSVGSTTAMWDRQIPAFADRHRCVLLDHPGHGASQPIDHAVTIEDLADDVLVNLDGFGITSAHFVGLSLGAMIAMNIAARRPDRVERLALLCTTSHFDDELLWRERAALVRADGMQAVRHFVNGRWLTSRYADAHPREVELLEAMLTSTDPESYARCGEAIGAMDQRPVLPDVQAPTLVVAGVDDPATPPSHAETIAGLITGARLELVDAAHLANWERPADVNRLLADHLAG